MALLSRLSRLVELTLRAFADCGGTARAATIAYYGLLSLFPLAAVTVIVAGAVLDEATLQGGVIDAVADTLPLTSEGEETLRRALAGATDVGAAAGVAGAAALVWTASGMAGAVRSALNAVSGVEATRPFLVGKAIDLLAVLAGALVILASAALTVVVRVAGDAVLSPLGLPLAGALLGLLAPVALAAAALAAVMRWMPARPLPWPGVWRAAVVGAVALWLLATLFGAYLERFGRYNAIYGSLGAAAALLVFAYLAAIVMLVSAAAASRWRDAGAQPPQEGPGVPLARRLRNAAIGLVVRRP